MDKDMTNSEGYPYTAANIYENSTYYPCTKGNCERLYTPSAFQYPFGPNTQLEVDGIIDIPTSITNPCTILDSMRIPSLTSHKTPRGKNSVLYINKFLYVRQRVFNEKAYYRCYTQSCKSRGIMKDKFILQSEHSHEDHSGLYVTIKNKRSNCLDEYKSDVDSITAPNSSLVFTKSQKGKLLLYVDFFLYKENRKYSNKIYYKCHNKSCQARAIVQSSIFTLTKPHNHATEEAKYLSFNARNAKKDSSDHGQSSKQNDQILRQHNLYFTSSISKGLKPYLSLQRNFNTTCHPAFNTNVRSLVPKFRTEIQLFYPLTVTHNFEPFLIGNADKDVFVFATPIFLQMLSCSTTIFLEGTRFLCPRLYKQLYTVHVMHKNSLIPVVYSILRDVNQASYETMFEIIIQLAQRHVIALNFEEAVMNYEIGAMLALTKKFPEILIRGSYTHFARSLLQKIQSLGLSVLYKNNSDFQKMVRRCLTIPFAKEGDVNFIFQLSVRVALPILNESISAFINYFNNTFIKPDATFTYDIWKMYDAIDQTTMDDLKIWRKQLKKYIPYSHPSIYLFINCLKDLQCKNERMVLRLDRGNNLNQKYLKYKHIDGLIADMTRCYKRGTMPPIRYIDNVSQLLYNK